MTINSMIDSIIRTFGFESPTTIMFAKIAEKACWDFAFNLYEGIIEEHECGLI